MNLKKSIFTFLAIFIVGFSIHGQDCVELYFDHEIEGSELSLHLRVNNFVEITTFQFGVVYPSNNLEYIDFLTNPDLSIPEASANGATPGTVKVLWSQPMGDETIADGDTLLTFTFNMLNNDPSQFQIVDLQNFKIAFSDASFDLLCYFTTPITTSETLSILSGKVYHDVVDNCTVDNNDAPAKATKVMITGDNKTYYRSTDASGNYSIALPIGTYTISPVNDFFWTACVPSTSLTIDEDGKAYILDHVMSKAVECSGLRVNIVAPRMRRCMENTYVVNYKNRGTSTATEAYIEVLLDDLTTYVSSTNSNLTIDGQVATILLGDVPPGDEASFEIVVETACLTAIEGNTICADARIFPNPICDPPASWSGAFITSEIQCDGDSVILTVENPGLQDMIAPLQSIVVEDDVMINIQNIELEAESNITYKINAGGGVYRIITEQENDYPYGNYTSKFIESCDGMNNTSFQFVSMFQEGDESPYLDTDCSEIINTFIPNDKIAYPVGYRDDHEINANEDIEFTIRFQNPGTDTIAYMYIEDEIDESLDLTTLEMGSSSHLYATSIIDERTLRIDFFNILLPNQQTNPEKSLGFVKYRISQKPDVSEGTLIKNSSKINFDFTTQVTTNETFHLIAKDFIDILLSDKSLSQNYSITIGPNPASDIMIVRVPNAPKQLKYKIYDINGSIIRAANCDSDVFYIEKASLTSGIYYLIIESKDNIIGIEQIQFK